MIVLGRFDCVMVRETSAVSDSKLIEHLVHTLFRPLKAANHELGPLVRRFD